MLSFGFIILKMQRFESLDIIKFWYRCMFFCSFGAWFDYFTILVLNIFEFFLQELLIEAKMGADAVNSIWHTQSAKGNAISSTVKK